MPLTQRKEILLVKKSGEDPDGRTIVTGFQQAAGPCRIIQRVREVIDPGSDT